MKVGEDAVLSQCDCVEGQFDMDMKTWDCVREGGKLVQGFCVEEAET